MKKPFAKLILSVVLVSFLKLNSYAQEGETSIKNNFEIKVNNQQRGISTFSIAHLNLASEKEAIKVFNVSNEPFLNFSVDFDHLSVTMKVDFSSKDWNIEIANKYLAYIGSKIRFVNQ